MVAPAHEHHALIPNADRSALLLAGGRLPVVRVQEPVIRAALTALAREHGVRAPFLRVIRRAEEGEDVTTLLELDAPAEEPRGEWMPLRAVEPSSIAPVLADGVEGWLAEQSGASIPAERPPWARPGWLADACAWVADIAAVRGEPGLVRQWPLSAVYRFDTEADALYLKAVFSLFRHEPAVSAALAREHPGAVPDVVATDNARGWILTRELRGGYARGESACDGLRTAARIHRAWAERADELRSLGCHDRGLGDLRAEAPKLAPLCDRLADYGIADSIVHGDLHHGNILVRDDGVAVIDWSDAAIGPAVPRSRSGPEDRRETARRARRRIRRALAGQRPARSGRDRRGARLRVPGDQLPRDQRGVRARRPVAVRESARRVDGARYRFADGLL